MAPVLVEWLIFSNTDNTFRVVLPNVNYKKVKQNIIMDATIQEEMIINYMKSYKKVKRQEIDELLNVSATRTKNILSKLLKKEIIERRNIGKNTYYTLNDLLK